MGWADFLPDTAEARACWLTGLCNLLKSFVKQRLLPQRQFQGAGENGQEQ